MFRARDWGLRAGREQTPLEPREQLLATLSSAHRALARPSKPPGITDILFRQHGTHAPQTRGNDASRLPATESDLLRASTIVYVEHLRSEGLPPERMLIRVKEVLAEARRDWPVRPVAADAIKEDVVRWSVVAYYAK
jgi:hypothetical protein